MSWYAPPKQAAVDPDNPTADEQFPFSEHNAMVAYLKDKIINKTVNAAAIGDDKILVYDLASDTFVFETQNEITALNDIPDVTISGVPADNEVLAYDTATSKFINQTAAEAGLALVANVVLEADFNATTFLYATADNTPQPKTIAETLVILDVESGADATDATNVNAAGAVMESDFDATTFLYATADNTPQPKTRAETMALLSGTATAEFLLNTQKIGGVVDPTTAQQVATKNYNDTHLFTKEVVTNFTNDYVPIYKTASGKFEMEEQSAALGLPVADTSTIVKGSVDGTKLVRFEVDGLTTGTTRVMTVPDKDMTIADTAEVMLLNGSQAMTSNLHMEGHYIDGLTYLFANNDSTWLQLHGGTVGNVPASIYLYGEDNASYPGRIRFVVPNAAKSGWQVAMDIPGVSDTPIVDIFHGLDMNDKVIADMKNSAASALSGTQKDIEIDIGGTPYYFTVYPTKA